MTAARTRPIVDLSGMPPAENVATTRWLVGELLDDLAAGRDAAVVRDVEVIRGIAGPEYTKELTERLAAIYRAEGI